MNIKNILFQIFVWGACLALGIRLFYLVRDDRRADEEKYLQLQLQADAVEKTDDKNLEALTEIYERYYDQIAVPEIICWGDNAMAGSRDKSLALSLKSVMEEELFSQLSRTFDRVFEQEKYTIPSAVINNMGVYNEGMRQILVRAGVNTLQIGEWIQIPGEVNPVTVRLMDDEAWESDDKDAELKFAKQSDVTFGKVSIAGIEGSLVTTDDWFDSSHPRYAFVRDEEGYRQSVNTGTEVFLESASRYIGQVPVFFFENDTGRSIDGLVSDIGKLVNRYAVTETDIENEEEDYSVGEDEEDEENKKPSYDLPFVIICTTKEDSDLDKALRNQFGDYYIRNEETASEMTDSKYWQLAQKVYNNLDAQGCFTDVQGKVALALKEAEER